MSRPRVLCMADLSMAPEALDILRRAADVDLVPADRRRLLETIHEYEAVWTDFDVKLDREVLTRATRLRAICSATTGTDHIDKAFMAARGIRLLCIKNDFGLLNQFTATAECAWLLLLACARHLRLCLESSLSGSWDRAGRRGRQLSGMTLGVLGVGRLGRMTVDYGQAFRMRVLGCDLQPFAIPGVERVAFEELLAQSDAISIHIHLTAENTGLFGDAVFARMKPGAILINTSRGDVVDEPALLRALAGGRLAAYGTDVLHDEWRGDMSTSALVQYARQHPNVVITPHIGGNTDFSVSAARVFSARKLAHFLQTGEELTMP
jgi:D-3-phosphoglycerate dehydrogenase / 2-oxoglutarate reductase